ncbi:putative membrane-bound ClpP-class protease associated with aq_911 [Rhodovastum atsumiense]|uniref:Nodulation protein NfeD n=1 Tax=Rhodovastum atsumiense TaxID=504468 RepID=A0A5M6IST5_9PROT|nr:nodulation protein NfeD [Rhodovastum atsumiense]KAA5610628.1 nodulation protein NfeD [Rhodovastum atsumiense]CAH2600749.1 putative membrane-bound ClpP-class protease associated with aq_911 [Rhodovastum atsumiense]
MQGRRRRAQAWMAMLLAGAVLLGAGGAARGDRPLVPVIALDGAIGPATAVYVVRNLHLAVQDHATAVVLRLDTPGGLDSAMREIVRAMLASPVPVIGYVAPAGARAASAGTYILYASAIAAMAPGTNLGAATPVPLGGEAPLPGPARPLDAGRLKAVNDAAAYIRGLAALHGRNAAWAERAVREAVSLSYEAALREHVVDLVASGLPDLLAAADGREVVAAGRPVRLATRDAVIRPVAPDWRDRLLATLTNPGLLYLLLLAGMAGIAFELSHPGILAPGVLGVICLLLASYGLNLLPIDHAGAALLLFGLALMVAEAWVPSFGALGIGGAAAFLIGSLMMFEDPGFRPPLALILGATLACLALFAGVLAMLLRARRRPVVSGDAMLIGAAGQVTAWHGTEGQVCVRGEYWNARSNAGPGRALVVGGKVRVTGRDGLRLLVEAV